MISQGAALAVLVAGGCANLPEIPRGECGNRVIEEHEDCDSLAPMGMVCRPPGAAGQCHLDCRRAGDGNHPACPAGWGCDLDGICRPPAGTFEMPVPHPVGGIASLLAADFDGDGRADIVSRGPPGALGQAKVRFHYFDEQGELADTRLFPKLIIGPAIGDFTGQGRRDLVFSTERVGVMLGRPDRGWVPESYGSYRLPDAEIRVVSVYDQVIEGISSGILVVTTLGGLPGYYVPDSVNGQLQPHGPLGGPVEALAGDPVVGQVIEDPAGSPCRQIVVAQRKAVRFSMVDGCVLDAGVVRWRPEFEQRTIELDPPATIDVAPQLADMDQDGHLDVLLGAGGRLYVARGDGHGLAVARPYQLPLANADALWTDPGQLPVPLAVGDFSGDGFVDFVFGDRLLISTPTPGSALPSYFSAHPNYTSRWTEAKIADLNGNGKLDVVAASAGRLDIDFFNGTGTADLTDFFIPTNGPVQHLTVEDFDGDLVKDLAFVETGVSDQGKDSVLVAFGNMAGPPLAPTLVARVGHVQQLFATVEMHLGQMGVASLDTSAGHRDGLLTLMDSSGDRIPFAPYRLTNFAADGSIEEAAAFGVAAGQFSGAGHRDAMALSTTDIESWRFWLLPSVDLPAGTPIRFDPPLDARLQPSVGAPDRVLTPGRMLESHVILFSATADVDRDGKDEALWAMPADGGQRCGLLVTGISAARPPQLEIHDTVVIDQPCPGGALVPVDADGDGWVDVAMLTGGPGLPGRQLLVLWNDGKGHFSNAAVTAVGVAEPQGFTVLPATPGRPFTFACVTDQGLVMTGATAPRQFGPPRMLAAVGDATGVVAADVNGDGVPDLVVASSGSLMVLKARLEPP